MTANQVRLNPADGGFDLLILPSIKPHQGIGRSQREAVAIHQPPLVKDVGDKRMQFFAHFFFFLGRPCLSSENFAANSSERLMIESKMVF